MKRWLRHSLLLVCVVLVAAFVASACGGGEEKPAAKQKISIATFDQNPLAVEQLRLGRADAVLADFPVAANDARLSEGKLEVVGTQFEAAPYGIGLRKDSTELNAAINKALQAIMNSGEYDKILADWGLEAGSMSPTAGAAASPTAAGVPELSDGTLQVGSDISYAPIEFYEEGTQNATGLDIDLANALARELGVKVEFVNTGFDGIIGALQANRFDVLMSAMTITAARQKEIDYIPYFTAGTGILVPAGNPKNIQTLADLCGKNVAVQLGTIQVDQLNAQNEQCS